MRLPIIVEADDGFHFFDSLSHAEASCEGFDIKNGIYAAYDADGMQLYPELIPAEFMDCRAELLPKLRDFLSPDVVPESEVSNYSFPELVQAGADHLLEREPNRFVQAVGVVFGAVVLLGVCWLLMSLFTTKVGLFVLAWVVLFWFIRSYPPR